MDVQFRVAINGWDASPKANICYANNVKLSLTYLFRDSLDRRIFYIIASLFISPQFSRALTLTPQMCT